MLSPSVVCHLLHPLPPYTLIHILVVVIGDGVLLLGTLPTGPARRSHLLRARAAGCLGQLQLHLQIARLVVTVVVVLPK